MTDIASLGLEVRSDGVVVATDRLGKFRKEAGLAEAAAGSLKRLATMGLAALAAGFAAFGVGIGAAVKRMEEMRKLTAQVDQALKNSGNSARTSAKEIEAWADGLEKRTGRAAEEVMAVSANLASFSFGRTEFFRSLELANDMSAAWGGDLRQNLEGLARALADPEKGLAMLTKRGITFTEEQKKMIDGFLKLNDLAGAQGVVFDALEQQVKGVAEKGYGGLTKAWGLAQKAWEDAFEAMVAGEGQSGDLRDSLADLADTISSPELINGVVALGNVVVRVLDGIAKVAVGTMNAFKQLMTFMNAAGGPMEALNQATGPLSDRTTENLKAQIAKRQQMLDADTARVASGGVTANGWFGTSIGATDAAAKTKAQISALQAELASRSDASKFNVNGTFDNLNTPQYGSKDDLIAGLDPGSSAAFTGGGAYDDFKYHDKDAERAGAKAEKAYGKIILSSQQFIAQQGLEASALGMTEEAASRLRHTQELLNDAANANIKLTPDQRKELEGLAASMAAAEEKTRVLTEAYQFGQSTFASFVTSIGQGVRQTGDFFTALKDSALSALGSIADYLIEMAAKNLFASAFGGSSGGGNWLSSLLGIGASFIGGTPGAAPLKIGYQTGIPGYASGTNSAPGGLSWVGEQGPELMNVPRGAQIYDAKKSAAMVGGNDNGIVFAPVTNITIGDNAGVTKAEVEDIVSRGNRSVLNALPGQIAAINRDPRKRRV